MQNNTIALVIDDSETNRYLLKRQLQLIGVNQIHERDDGSTALEFLKEEFKNTASDDFPPTVIFLDLNMPTLDGFAFLDEYTKLVEKKLCPETSILVYSSSDRSDDIQKATQYECVKAFLIKGEATLDQIKETIQSIA